jgi:hypothetical protein
MKILSKIKSKCKAVFNEIIEEPDFVTQVMAWLLVAFVAVVFFSILIASQIQLKHG